METIYRWFTDWYGSNLAEHLSGWDEIAGDYVKANLFNDIGIWTLIIIVAECVWYYYILNHPRANRKWIWMIRLGGVALINFFFAFGKVYHDLRAGNVSSDISNISGFECMGFGVVNFILSIFFFTICSFIIKWRSRNCKYSPL